ncbi:hypothetical protein ACA910_021301 [Epithemia clementina (nom. ined.)]
MSTTTLLVVPSRPSPSQHRPRSFSENAVGILQQQQQQHNNQDYNPNNNNHNPNHTLNRTLALSQGLALTLHRALQPTSSSTASTARAAGTAASTLLTTTTSMSSATTSSATPTAVPRLHRPEGFGNAAAAAMNHQNSSLVWSSSVASSSHSDPDATEFLSRILLMLASFVVLCLLLF